MPVATSIATILGMEMRTAVIVFIKKKYADVNGIYCLFNEVVVLNRHRSSVLE